MIHHLKGTLAELELTHAVIDCGGVGYFVSIPMSTYDRLPRPGAQVLLRTHLVVREDDWLLYGFASEEERVLFRLVVGVSGIGPKTALAVLSCLPVKNFAQALLDADVKLLSKINGVGKKTAERMVVELRDKVGSLAMGGSRIGGPTPAQGLEDVAAEDGPVLMDACLALEALGYRPDTVRKTVKEIFAKAAPDKRSSEHLVKQALAELNR